MSDRIDIYLRELKREMNGCDAALVQDALADAEEHLRTALQSNTAEAKGGEQELQAIIESYGSPQEIAQAYREVETYTQPALARRTAPVQRGIFGRFFGVLADSRAWGALLYLLLSGITGVLYFTWAFSGLSLSLALSILVIGLPFAALFLMSVRSIVLMEGRLVEALLGVRMPRRPLFTNREEGWMQRVKTLMFEKRTWMAVFYMVLQGPLGVLYFMLVITLLSASLGAIFSPVLQWISPEPIIMLGSQAYILQGWQLVLLVLGGFLLLNITMHLVKLLGRLHGKLARAMLVGAR